MTQASTPLVLNQTVHRHVLPNGIVLLVIENPTADIIAGRLFFRTGSLREQRHQAGLSHLLAATLTKGTDQLTSLEIAERVESVGARLSTDTTSDYFLVSLKTVSEDFTEILRLTAEMLRSPSFPESEIDLERRIAIQAIRSQQEQPFSIAFNALRQLLYQDHPYAISSLGTEETVAQLTQDVLQIFHQAHFRPDNMVVAFA
ncbi:MAG: M16 family metallopeptidase, partial [Microcoleaceae cyanobacterium]